ncbi:hypothetical protein Z946_1281 [Sulfitobacter noctilucicola]|nr:hypothetical protein Z946_1281 [Sulfitobacter noctilucicola]
MNIIGQLPVRHPAIALKRSKDTPINLIKAHWRINLAFGIIISQDYPDLSLKRHDNSQPFASRIA